MTTSERVCANHQACERNKRVAFRLPQVCLTCESRPAKHYIQDGSAYILRCDECLASNVGCPHAAPHVCADCYDAITLELHQMIDYHKKKAEPRPCIKCKYVPKVVTAQEVAQ